MFKKFLCAAAVLVLVTSNFCFSGFASALVKQDIGFEPKSKSVLLVNLDTGLPVYEKDADARLPMASLTKIMTAILTIEAIEKLPERENTKVLVKDEILKLLEGTGSSMSNIKKNKELTVMQLLHCLMIPSGNDAALILADFIGGSIQSFVELMNKRAKELGCNNTHFVNPHGLDSDDHYSTARDLTAMQNHAKNLPFYTDVTSLATSKILGDDGPLLVTSNFMIDKNRGGKYYYKYAKSGKTGSDTNAGKCLISMADNGKYSYICTVLGGFPENNSNDNMAMLETKSLYDWAFKNLEMRKVAWKNTPVGEVKLNFAWGRRSLFLNPAKDYSVMLPKDILTSSLDYKINIPDLINAPVFVGQNLGTATLSYANSPVVTIDLVSNDAIKRSNILFILSLIRGVFTSLWFRLFAGIILALFTFYVMLLVKQNKRRKRRRRRSPYRRVRF